MIPADAERLYELYENPQITRYMESLFPNIEEERAYMDSYYENVYRFYGYGMWLVTLKDGTVIGRAGIEHIPEMTENQPQTEGETPPEHELGYMLGVPYQHQGYALEACRAILDYARDELGITDVAVNIHPENKPSLRLAEKLGLKNRRKT
jgi:RimJ/RimL family protein N-acetyltransferase